VNLSILRPLLLGLVLLAPGVARAEDSAAEDAIGLPGFLGLAGFQDMVDARVPSLLSVRAGLRYDLFVTEQDFRGAIDAKRDVEQHDVGAYVGVSALGLLDAAIRLPFVYRRDDVDLGNVVDQFKTRYDEGWADLDAAGKVSFDLGPVALAPFVFGRLPSGEPDVRDLARFEYGVAATFSILDEYLAIHGNLAGVQVEKGLQAFRYRAGASIVVLATDALLVRVYGYGDGIEYEGDADSDFDLDFGAQAILLGMFTVEVGTTVRVVDAEFLDEDIEGGLEAGGLDDRFDDDGTWGLHLSAGVILNF
jgi:hypothetical protein